EVGMSHLGLKILYYILNSRVEIQAERVFAPWPDMERRMRSLGIPLLTLETRSEVKKTDILGFSLQYELCATTVLQMLDLAGIPIQSRDRGDRDPIVLGGGPICFNPLPLSDFFDAFLIGEGEEAILEIADLCMLGKKQGGDRLSLLQELKQVPGIYVPSLNQPDEIIARRIVSNLDAASFPNSLVVPFCEITHDRVGLEIARGCTRGCRFCQAGMIYRPVRERTTENLLNIAQRLLSVTGWDEIGLLSLSSGDYSTIGDLIRKFNREFSGRRIAISLPSLRTDTFDSEIAAEIKKVRKTGFTLAPEAGTQRLRNVINKGNSEEDLKHAIVSAFSEGWKSVKLYFMIGLPTETDEDLQGITDIIFKASRWGRAGKIKASISTFVPKAHTPFQWAGQISREETSRRQAIIRNLLGKKSISLKFHNPKLSFLEGVLARGDTSLSKVIEGAFLKGARFDGWDEQLKLQSWIESFDEFGVDPTEYLQERQLDSPLPWEFIHTGVSKEYLVEELLRGLDQGLTSDCRSGDCCGCGVCDFEKVAPVIQKTCSGKTGFEPAEIKDQEPESSIKRYRLKYSKLGLLRFLGHQDVVRCFEKTFRRANLSLDFSHGFHPHPRLRFSPPLALGVQSFAEYLDFDMKEPKITARQIFNLLEDQLPEGLKPLQIIETSLNEPPLSAKIQTVSYEIALTNKFDGDVIKDRLNQFFENESFIISFGSERKRKTRDLKKYISSIFISDQIITMRIKMAPSGSVNPYEAIRSILNLTDEETKSLNIVKTAVEFES
ncbi:MAG: TIGR03960 family B12-binding radical SAM protein, partial [Pseudomonadota bacterium]